MQAAPDDLSGRSAGFGVSSTTSDAAATGGVQTAPALAEVVCRAGFMPPRPGGHDRLFYVHHRPAQGAVRAELLYLHPIGDEMNKSRRMAAQQARALAARGWSVWQVDLSGCGDSEGDFEDAGWDLWIEDALHAVTWLRRRGDGGDHANPSGALWLWGLRSGCLLAGAIAQRLPECAGLLLWQPVSAGKMVLQQFLRLRTAGDMLAGQSTVTTQGLRTQLQQGQVLDIAGYRLSPTLAAGLDNAVLQPPPVMEAVAPNVVWLELSNAPQAELSPAARTTGARWRQAGVQVQMQLVGGPAFWQTSEIEDAPALVQATLDLLAEANTPSTAV